MSQAEILGSAGVSITSIDGVSSTWLLTDTTLDTVTPATSNNIILFQSNAPKKSTISAILAACSTTNLPEGTNLYYTDSRARAAISSSATGLTYTSGTGVFSFTSGYSIPTTTNQTNWNSAYTQRLQWSGGSTNLVAAAGRTSLGLGTMATQAASAVAITGGTISGLSSLTASVYYGASGVVNLVAPSGGYVMFTGGNGSLDYSGNLILSGDIDADGDITGAAISGTTLALSAQPALTMKLITSAQTISQGSYVTIIHNSEDTDNVSMHSTSTGVTTIPSAGRYQFCASFRFDSRAWVAGDYVTVGIIVNDTTVRWLGSHTVPYGYTGVLHMPCSSVAMTMAANDTVKFIIYQTNSVNGTISLSASSTGAYTWASVDKLN